MRLPLIFLVVAIVVAGTEAQTYTNKYDNIDVDRILSNDRILNNYIKCMLDEGPCTAEGRELKKSLPDALNTACDKCTEKQRSTTDKVYRHLTTKRPGDWERLANKFDPQGNYKRKYEALYGAQ